MRIRINLSKLDKSFFKYDARIYISYYYCLYKRYNTNFIRWGYNEPIIKLNNNSLYWIKGRRLEINNSVKYVAIYLICG